MQTIIGKEFPTKVIPLIDGAKHEIKVMVFDWRWYTHDAGCSVQLFNQAIVRAKKRGVKIKAIANVYEVLEVLRNQGCLVKKLHSLKLMHVKMLIVDNDTIVIGSHNYTQKAFTVNFEISVILKRMAENAEEMDRLNEFFDFQFACN